MSHGKCWAYGQNPDEPCWGEVETENDGIGYCAGHAHPENKEPYLPRPVNNTTIVVPTRRMGMRSR